MKETKFNITQVEFELTNQELKVAVKEYLEDKGKFTSGDEVYLHISSKGEVKLVCKYKMEATE